MTNFVVIRAQAGIRYFTGVWMPEFTGMTM